MFLDNELEAYDFEYMAIQLAAAPYTLTELESILFAEVYPICIANLQTTAGEWTGFDLDWLEQKILRRESTPFKVPGWLQTNRGMIREEWQRVKQLVQTKRETDSR